MRKSVQVVAAALILAIVTFGAFSILNRQPSSTTLTAITPTLSQAAYPLPATPTRDLTPHPTVIVSYNTPAYSPPPPPGTPRPPTLTPSEELRKVLMGFPSDRRLIIDDETIAVIGIGKGDVHDGEERRDRMVIVPHHIPSLSVMSIDLNGIVNTNFKSADGEQHLKTILANTVLMQQLHDFLAAYVSKLPK